MGRVVLRRPPVGHRHCELVQARQQALHSSACSPANGGVFFRLSEQQNRERSPLPLLTVLLLLTGGDKDKSDGASEREDGTSGVWAPKESFLSAGRGQLGDLAATGVYRNSPTTPLPKSREGQSQMSRIPSTKSGSFK